MIPWQIKCSFGERCFAYINLLLTFGIWLFAEVNHSNWLPLAAIASSDHSPQEQSKVAKMERIYSLSGNSLTKDPLFLIRLFCLSYLKIAWFNELRQWLGVGNFCPSSTESIYTFSGLLTQNNFGSSMSVILPSPIGLRWWTKPVNSVSYFQQKEHLQICNLGNLVHWKAEIDQPKSKWNYRNSKAYLALHRTRSDHFLHGCQRKREEILPTIRKKCSKSNQDHEGPKVDSRKIASPRLAKSRRKSPVDDKSIERRYQIKLFEITVLRITKCKFVG